MTINETYQTVNRIIAKLQSAYNDEVALNSKNKTKPLNMTVAWSLSQLQQLAEGQLPNE